ncbi:MAG TPA: hypothetical protein ACFYEM_01580 [Candidatus Hypogeohydataceae bacterium YC40]
MESEKGKKFHFSGLVLTRKIRGWKGLVSFVNLGLSAAVMGLVIFNILFFLVRADLPTEIEPTVTVGVENRQEVVEAPPRKDPADYTLIVSKNIFSPDRKEWEELPQVAQQPPEKELDQTLSERSGLSILGVVIAGGVKKVLLKGKKDTIFLKEGEAIDGYKVVGIEPKRIRMDLDGKEFFINLYKDIGALSGTGQSSHEGEEEEVPELSRAYPPDTQDSEEVNSSNEGLGGWRPSHIKP